MAVLKIGSFFVEASGKIGGVQIGRNNGQVIMSNKSAGNLSGSNSQQVQRAQTASIMAQWSQLTDTQRAAWTANAATYSRNDIFADAKKINGFQLFNIVNQNRLRLNLSLAALPTAHDTPTPPQVITITATDSAILLTSDGFASNTLIDIYVSPIISRGTNNPKKYLRRLITLTAAQLAAGYDIFTPYTDRYGSISDGQNFYIGLKTISNISYYSQKKITVNKPVGVVGGTPPPAYDADAQAFIDAVGTLDTSQEVAINNLVLGLKANGTWLKYLAIYPFIGGTASSHKYNLKNPLDTDTAFRLNFIGSWTHSANGALGSVTNTFAQTFIKLSEQFTAISNTLDINFGYYCNAVATANSNWNQIGNWGGATGTYGYLTMNNGTNTVASCFTSGSDNVGGLASYKKYSQYGALNGTAKYMENGVLVSTHSQTSSVAYAEYFTLNAAGLASPTSAQSGTYSATQCAFAVIGDGLSEIEMSNDYSVIQAYQAALSREN